MLINRRERDPLQRAVGWFSVSIMHALARGAGSQAQVKRVQVWMMPLFIFAIVIVWFLLVQFSFSLIIWGVGAETNWLRSFVASGSALSTLGFLTPKTTVGEMLAIFEAAIGLGIVILLFTFVPGYQTAIQVRERKGGWLNSRSDGSKPACVSLLESLHRSGQTYDPSVWQEWEAWFRGLLETHSISPVLAYVPSIYRGNWLDTAATILDASSLLLVSAESKDTEAARICRATGVAALRIISAELIGDKRNARPEQSGVADTNTALTALQGHLQHLGLPAAADKTRWVQSFTDLRAEYTQDLGHISRATLMPFQAPWERPPPDEWTGGKH